MARSKEAQAQAAKRHYEKNKLAMRAKAKAWTDQRRIEHTTYLRELKEKTPCMDCGESYSYYVMDFDHRDPETKEAGLASLCKRGVSWERLLREIEKCDIVCSNCHRERTHGNDAEQSSGVLASPIS